MPRRDKEASVDIKSEKIVNSDNEREREKVRNYRTVNSEVIIDTKRRR